MRKLLVVALAVTALAPSVASAQSAGEIRRDNREVTKDQREVDRDLAKGKIQEAREDAHETQRDRNETNRDWQDYRRTHRTVYTRPAYVWPHGHRYNRLSVGSTLDNAFWGPRYRVSNYSTYRLSNPGHNRQWVRYGNDVVLINVRTGRIITVYNNFFY